MLTVLASSNHRTDTDPFPSYIHHDGRDDDFLGHNIYVMGAQPIVYISINLILNLKFLMLVIVAGQTTTAFL
jgi:hypothetical protein